MEPEPTQHYGQTRDEEVKISHFIAYGRGYKEPDPTGVLSPNNSHCLFQVDSLARHLLQLAYNTNIRAVDRTDKIC